MEIPKSSSTSSRPLAIGNSGILSGFSGDIFKMAVQLRRSAEFISEANARFFGHSTCPSRQRWISMVMADDENSDFNAAETKVIKGTAANSASDPEFLTGPSDVV